MQEVGGSSPPVPTTSQRSVHAAPEVRDARSIRSPRTPCESRSAAACMSSGHRHASRRIRAPRALGHVGAGVCLDGAAAERRPQGAGGDGRRPDGRSVASRWTRRVADGSSRRTVRRRCRCTVIRPPTCWRRRSPACTRTRSAASVRPPTRGSSTTSSCRARSCPRTSRRSRRRCASWPSQDLPYERQIWPREEALGSSPARGEPLKVQLIEEKTAGQPHVSCYTIKDRDTFVDFCVGPHVPSTGRLKAFKLLQRVERLLEGRRAQSADAAHLRHGVLQGRRSEAAPASDRGSQEARPSAGRQATWACSGSIRGRPARRSGSARARRSTTCSPTTCARCSSPPATPR